MPALNWATIKTNIFDWIDPLTSSTVIWGRQMAPQPPPQYITLRRIAGPTRLGAEDELRFNPDTNVFFTAGLREFTLSIQSFGSNAFQDLIDIMAAVEDPDVFESLRAKELALVNTPSIIDLTQQLETVFEGRASMDLIFRTPDNRELSTTFIETAEINGDLDDGRITTTDLITLP